MHKYLLKISSFIILFVLVTSFTTKNVDERAAIMQVLEKQRSAWNKGNMEEYMQGYWKSDSLKFVGKKGIQYGYQKTLDNYKKSYKNASEMGHLVFDIIDVQVFRPENAFVLGKWKLERQSDTLSGHFTLLFKKMDKDWKIVTDHSS
jgi:uncharacterized protein (TIGR02246 family)